MNRGPDPLLLVALAFGMGLLLVALLESLSPTDWASPLTDDWRPPGRPAYSSSY